MSAEKLHAELAPSAASRWMPCPGSVILTEGLIDIPSSYAVEGTDYHELAATVLESDDKETRAEDLTGRRLPSGAVVDEDKAYLLQKGYVEPVRAYAELGTLLIEEPVSLAWYTGVSTDEGTSDAVVIGESELIVADLKFGMGVPVSPVDNPQLKIYALGVIEKHGLHDQIKQVRLVICQPRAGDGKPQEWVVGMPELLLFKEALKRKAQEIEKGKKIWRESKVNTLPLVPSEKSCKFCKARGTCQALLNLVNDTALQGFEACVAPGNVLLADAMDKADIVEIWLNGVRGRVELELLSGNPVPGYKLVQGRKGNRKWVNEDLMEKMMKETFRMTTDEMYTYKLATPTVAEKRIKKEHPRRWETITDHITQSEGTPSVAKASDKRPAMVLAVEDTTGFSVIESADDIL